MRMVLLLLVAFTGICCDWRGPQSILEGHEGSVHSITWSPDGSKLASASRLNYSGDNTLRIWDATSSREVQTIRADPRKVSWSPDGTRISWCDIKLGVEVWDVESGTRVHLFKARGRNRLTAVAWSPDGKRIATGGGGVFSQWGGVVGSWEPEITVIDSATGNVLLAITGRRFSGSVRHLVWSPDGSKLVSVSTSGGCRPFPSIQVWDAERGIEVQSLKAEAPELSDIAWSPDGTRLAGCGMYERKIIVWDLASAERVHALKSYGLRIVWGAAGGRFSCGRDQWESGSGNKIFTIPYNGYGELAWGLGGRRVAVAGQHKTVFGNSYKVWVWDTASGKLISRMKGLQNGVSYLVWSPDGTRLASPDGPDIKIWSIPK